MSSDSSPVRVEAKVDGTNALNRLVLSIGKGLGRVFTACFGKREADIAAYKILAIEQAKSDAGRIARREGVLDRKSGEVKPLPPDEQIAQLLIEGQEERTPKNIAACLDHAAIALEEASAEEKTDQKIAPDFLDAWLDGAKRVNTEYLQKVWGRILALNIREENAISIRTIISLAQVSQQEAELFTHFLEYRLGGMIVLPNPFPQDGIDDLKFGEVLVLTDAGFLIPERGVAQSNEQEKHETLHTFIGNKAIVKIETDPIPRFGLGGRALSIMGVEVAKIAEPAPMTKAVLKYFYDVLSKKYPGKIKGIYAYKIMEETGKDKIEYADEPLFSYVPSSD